MPVTQTAPRPATEANELEFTGDRTSITYFPQTPGPVIAGHEGGELRYAGPEGTLAFYGAQIERLESPLGTLLTVLLRPNDDAGAIKLTVLVPDAFGVTHEQPVTFGTLAIKTTGRGFVTSPGVALTYDVLPLVGVAKDVILPL